MWGNGQPHSRSFDLDGRLVEHPLGADTQTLTYDAAGNPLTDGVADYTWNAAGRLTKTMARSIVSDHLYNGLGERLLKIGSRSTRGGPYLYVYNTAGQLIGDYEKTKGAKQTTNWVQQQETVWLGDIPVAVIKQPVATEPAQVYFIHADHLNTPRLIVDQTNTTIWRWNNKNAFGNNPPDEDPNGDRKRFEYNLRFAGQYFDTETNLHYNYFRDYEAVTGRYLSSDPIGLAGGINTYGYVYGNPINFIDPDGLLGFNFNQFANDIRDNRSNTAVDLAILGSALTFGTMPKTSAELRGLGVPRNRLSPTTSQLSRWNGRLNRLTNGATGRTLRDFGRTPVGIAAGTIATGALIVDGFYNWSVIIKAAYDATSLDSYNDNKCE